LAYLPGLNAVPSRPDLEQVSINFAASCARRNSLLAVSHDANVDVIAHP